jgi:hypothetical protein
MPHARTGLLRRWGKCAGKSCGIKQIRPYRVFRDTHDQCSHNANEISALRAELVFRDVPGELVQWGGQPQWFRTRWGLDLALVETVSDGVVCIPAPPSGLGLLPSRGLAFPLPAGMLAVSYSGVRPEPPTADRARFLPERGHGSFIFSMATPPCSVHSAWVSSGKQGWVNSRERRSPL